MICNTLLDINSLYFKKFNNGSETYTDKLPLTAKTKNTTTN